MRAHITVWDLNRSISALQEVYRLSYQPVLSLSVPIDGTYLFTLAFDFILLFWGLLHIPLPSEKQRLGGVGGGQRQSRVNNRVGGYLARALSVNTCGPEG